MAWADIPKGDLDGTADALSDPDTTVVVGSTVYPYGTTEKYADAQDNEGHYYAECGARGLCNREEGLCECFPGFEGYACQRSICPNLCSGHGACDSLKEMAEDKEEGDGVSLMDWSGVGNLHYDLWDRNKIYGCSCDDGWEGADCSLKMCVKGVDPLYRGDPVYEKAYVEVYASSDLSGTFDMVIFDNLGSRYVLDNLPYMNYYENNTLCDEIMDAFPNNKIQDTVVGSTTYPFCTVTAGSLGTHGLKIKFDFRKGNPGYHKDMYVQRIEPSTGSNTNIKYWIDRQGMDAEYSEDLSEGFTFTLPGYIKDLTDGATVFNMTKDVSDFIQSGNTSHPDNMTDTKTKWISITDVDDVATTYEVVAIDTLTYAIDAANNIQTTLSQITVAKPLSVGANVVNGAPSKITVQAPLSDGYEYVSHCAGRGACNQETGLCECFSGYKTVNCDTQAPQC